MDIYNYTTPAARVKTAAFLRDYASGYRAALDLRWDTAYDYYSGRHRTQAELARSCADAGIPWITAMCPDPYRLVENAVVPDVPSFEFYGRDDDLDSEKAWQREYVVKYILEQNRVADHAASNDRRCIIMGSCAWKVYWESSDSGGDIRVRPVDPRCLFPDPSAKSLDECEYLIYAYPMHRRAFARVWADEIRRLRLDVTALGRTDDPFELPSSETYTAADDTVTVAEHWYRDADGDISCSVQCGGVELKHIDKYWRATAAGNKNYPFVIQRRTADADNFWGCGDLEPIIPLVDAVDRELSIAQLSGAFTGSDIILTEQDVFSEEPDNRPGALWRLKPGAIDRVRRLGGNSGLDSRIGMIDKLRELICEATGNIDVERGISGLTSATALAQLIERADARNASKKAERLNAYARLFHLIDWTALEFYDDDRVILLGGAGHREVFSFNARSLYDNESYYPIVDAELSTDDGLRRSNSYMISAIGALLGHGITRENWPLVIDMLKLIGVSDVSAIEWHFRDVFAGSVAEDDVPWDVTN